MSVFYAYAHDIHDANHWRILLVFATSAVAEEWWSAVSSSGTLVGRINSQLYTHDPRECNLLYFFTAACFKPIAARFQGRMFLSLQHDRGGRGIDTLPFSPQSSMPSNWPPVDVPPTPPTSTTFFPAVTESFPPSTTSSPPQIESDTLHPVENHPPAQLNAASQPALYATAAAVSPSSVQDELPPPPPNSHVLAAILFPDVPNAPKIYSKYIVRAVYHPSFDEPSSTLSLLVNADVAVPKFKSAGATSDPLTSQSALKVFFSDINDVTGQAQFWGMIGAGHLHFITDKKVVISGPIEGGPVISQTFVGVGTWLLS